MFRDHLQPSYLILLHIHSSLKLSACTADIASVSCGPPGGKQCSYSNQCLADSAGYNSNQCCNAVPDGIFCTADFKPVECGSIPCVYSNQCQADAAGATDCCAQVPEGVACTADSTPVTCGSEQCGYSNQCLADAAGYSSDQCCNAVPNDVACLPSTSRSRVAQALACTVVNARLMLQVQLNAADSL